VIFITLLLLPLIELTLLIYIGRQTSVLSAISLVIIAGILGTFLLRFQGLKTLARIQEDLRQNRPPADAILDGTLIALAGILLIIPGVVSDIVGLFLLLPPCRTWVRNRIRTRLSSSVRVQFHTVTRFHENAPTDPDTHPEGGREDTIDAEIVRRFPTPASLPPPKGSPE
jgi:UPF0716 protein FxsA